MRAIVIGLAGLCAAMASSGAAALEGMSSYDQFNRATLDPARWAQDYLNRASNAADAPGVLRVVANAFVCTNADCSTSSFVGSALLGTANVGTSVLLQIEWDKAGKRFLFSRDNGAQTGEVHYTQA